MYSSSAAQFDIVLEIAISLLSPFVRQCSLSLAEYTNTKTHKGLFRDLPHIGVLGYPSHTKI